MMGASPRSQTGFADYLDLLRVFDEREAEAIFAAKRLPGWQHLLGGPGVH